MEESFLRENLPSITTSKLISVEIKEPLVSTLPLHSSPIKTLNRRSMKEVGSQ